MKRLIVGLLLTLASSLAYAGEYQVSFGPDIRHELGATYLEIRDAGEIGSWYIGAASDSSFYRIHAGADLQVFKYQSASFSVGVSASHADSIVGTTLRYELRPQYQLSKHYYLQWVHESNCKYVCEDVKGMKWIPHPKHGPNSGSNFLTLSYRW